MDCYNEKKSRKEKLSEKWAKLKQEAWGKLGLA